jgi:hypothetical protein
MDHGSRGRNRGTTFSAMLDLSFAPKVVSVYGGLAVGCRTTKSSITSGVAAYRLTKCSTSGSDLRIQSRTIFETLMPVSLASTSIRARSASGIRKLIHLSFIKVLSQRRADFRHLYRFQFLRRVFNHHRSLLVHAESNAELILKVATTANIDGYFESGCRTFTCNSVFRTFVEKRPGLSHSK